MLPLVDIFHMWRGIYGHDEVVERFRQAIVAGRLGNTFLLVGPDGIGKRTLAIELAQALLCQETPAAELDPCDRCPSCAQIKVGAHPDLLMVGRPSDKSFIPVEALIGDKEHRMREGLCHAIGLKPFMGGRRIALIDDADFLNQEGANCLLKTLEEPPPRSVLFLIATSLGKQLPTIRSRAQIIRFNPLRNEVVARILQEQNLAADPQDALRIAAISNGSLQQAAELSEPELQCFRQQWLEALANHSPEDLSLARLAGQFVEDAGREAPLRRRRLRHVIRFSLELFRHRMRTACGDFEDEDPEMPQDIPVSSEERAARLDRMASAIDRCLAALEHIDRNANLSTLLECWLDDVLRPHAQPCVESSNSLADVPIYSPCSVSTRRR